MKIDAKCKEGFIGAIDRIHNINDGFKKPIVISPEGIIVSIRSRFINS